MTDNAQSSADPFQLARIERLRQRAGQPEAPNRPGSQPGETRRPTKRRHAAFGSRVVAAALGVSAMFGVVAALGFNAAAVHAQATLAPIPVASSRQVVVVHHSATAPGGGQDVATVSAASPIALIAQPVVRVVQAPKSTAPVARTNGSR